MTTEKCNLAGYQDDSPPLSSRCFTATAHTPGTRYIQSIQELLSSDVLPQVQQQRSITCAWPWLGLGWALPPLVVVRRCCAIHGEKRDAPYSPSPSSPTCCYVSDCQVHLLQPRLLYEGGSTLAQCPSLSAAALARNLVAGKL